jgi:hypothetical protein
MLGHKAKDKITGLAGVITAQAEFQTSPIRYELTGHKMEKGKPVGLWLDPERVVAGKSFIKPPTATPTVELGDKVKDRITGFEGIATGRFTFLSGCLRIEITPMTLEKGKPIEPQVFDEQRVLPDGKSKVKTGGPLDGPPALCGPSR